MRPAPAAPMPRRAPHCERRAALRAPCRRYAAPFVPASTPASYLARTVALPCACPRSTCAMSTLLVPVKYPASSSEDLAPSILSVPYRCRRGYLSARILAVSVSVSHYLSSIPTSTMEGLSLCLRAATGTAVRLEYLSSTPRSAPHEECTLSVPSRVHIFSTEQEDPCSHRVVRWFKVPARDLADTFHSTAGRTVHVAGIFTRTSWTARSPPRCRS